MPFKYNSPKSKKPFVKQTKVLDFCIAIAGAAVTVYAFKVLFGNTLAYVIGLLAAMCILLWIILDFKNSIKTNQLKHKMPFTVEGFNHWFNNEYDGYTGHKGAPGIFLRLDKFSYGMVSDYLRHLNHSEEEMESKITEYYEMVRQDWKHQKIMFNS